MELFGELEEGEVLFDLVVVEELVLDLVLNVLEDHPSGHVSVVYLVVVVGSVVAWLT